MSATGEAAPAAGEAIAGDARPRLAAHVRLQHDARRDRWVVQAPERLLLPDEIALEILQRCDGRTVTEIVADLARAFDAPGEEIRRDVERLIGDLAGKGILVT